MKNEKKYKETFNAISPSEAAVEKIYKITSSKNIFNQNKAFKRILATALAFALVISGGFCIDFAVEKFYSDNTDNTLGVYIAYGSERELLKLNNDIAPEIFYRHYVLRYDKNSDIDLNDLLEQKQKEIDQQLKNTRKFGKAVGASFNTITDENGEIIAAQYSVECGEFVLDIDDYAKVDKITVEEDSSFSNIVLTIITEMPNNLNEEGKIAEPEIVNEDEGTVILNDYGTIQKLELSKDGQRYYQTWYNEIDNNPGYAYFTQEKDKVSITGDELRKSYEIYQSDKMKELQENNEPDSLGYNIELNMDIDRLISADPDFDLTKVKSDIVFTVEYSDGTSQSSTVHYQLDKDGLMHLSLK